MKQYVEYVWGICFKIRMFGTPCEDPTIGYGYNPSFLDNNSITVSTGNNKSNLIDFHFVQEGFACEEWRKKYENTHESLQIYWLTPYLQGRRGGALLGYSSIVFEPRNGEVCVCCKQINAICLTTWFLIFLNRWVSSVPRRWSGFNHLG